MAPQYSIEIDRQHDLVRIALAGLFMPVHVAGFFEARRKAHLKLRCAHGEHVTLTDLRGLENMPQETVDAFTVLLADPQSRSRRLAFVLPSNLLLRAQLTRVLADRQSRCFSDPGEAQAWLLEEPQASHCSDHRQRVA
jgi:hypothetical protein